MWPPQVVATLWNVSRRLGRRASRSDPGLAVGSGPAIRARADRAQEAAARYFGVPHRRRLLSHLASGLSTGASLTDYYVLDRYIRVHRPLRVLELGSGLTSVIMAHVLQGAAAEQPDGLAGHLCRRRSDTGGVMVSEASATRSCPRVRLTSCLSTAPRRSRKAGRACVAMRSASLNGLPPEASMP